MKVLLDHCVPRQFARELAPHDVRTARAMGWAGLGNGTLLKAAGEAGFDVFITVDRNLSFQQNIGTLPLAVIAINAPDNKPPTLAVVAPQVLRILESGPQRRVYPVRF